MTEGDPAQGQTTAQATEPTSVNAQPDPWTDVVRSLDEFGRAMTAWASAVREDPDNRRRAKELQSQLEGVGKQIGEVVDSAVASDVAKQMSSAALATGEVMIGTAKRVSDEVSPYVASAFRTAAESIRGAAERIETKGTQPSTTSRAAAETTGAAAASGSGGESASEAAPEPAREPATDYIP